MSIWFYSTILLALFILIDKGVDYFIDSITKPKENDLKDLEELLWHMRQAAKTFSGEETKNEIR